MKKRYIIVLIVMIVCILSTIKFTYGRFTYESEVTGSVTTTSRNPFNVGTLSYSIVDNAMNGNTENQEKTIYSEEPKTTPAQEINEETERTLSVTEDDDGNSYYFRGNVKDNYIDFNNMCWRIVRIEGDGAIKLILEDKESTCKTATGGDNAFIGTGQYGYNNTTLNGVENVKVADYETCTLNSNYCMKKKFDEWFNENNFDKRLLKEDTWNLGDLNTFYGWDSNTEIEFKDNLQVLFNTSLKVIQLKLPMTLQKSVKESTIKDYIATLSAEELAYAGAKWSESNANYYLYNKAHDWVLLSLHKIISNTIHPFFVAGENNENADWWNYDGMGSIIELTCTKSIYLRPSIVLKKDIKLLSGDGTKTNAYKVDENPFKENTLAYEIVKNAQNVRDEKNTTNTTKLSPIPETTPAQEVSRESERTLSITEDDYGSSYYFRGNIEDNYLNFNNMCWRIVRIEGDGSVKLILEDKEKTCESATGGVNASIGNGMLGYGDTYYDYDYENSNDKENSAKKILDEWIKSFDKKLLKEEDWCTGNTTDWYNESGIKEENGKYSFINVRLEGLGQQPNAILNCNGKKVKDYIGLLTADEVVFGGFSLNSTSNSFLRGNSIWYILLSPKFKVYNDYKGLTAFTVRGSDGRLEYAGINDTSAYIRPSIVLIPNIELIQGDGTKSNPYAV